KTTFWLWLGNALYHSLILFTFTVILFWGDLKQATGLDSGHWFWGAMLYLAVLLTVLGKAALVSDLWTKYTVAAISGLFVFTMLFLPLYAVVAPAIGFSTEYYELVPRLWTDAAFYFVLTLSYWRHGCTPILIKVFDRNIYVNSRVVFNEVELQEGEKIQDALEITKKRI
ncbi:hypothetical protein BDR05DRAFT_1019498, partial [Suillus weaverae]